MQRNRFTDIVEGLFLGALIGAGLAMLMIPVPPCPKDDARIEPDHVQTAERITADCLVKGIDRAGKPAWLDAVCSRDEPPPYITLNSNPVPIYTPEEADSLDELVFDIKQCPSARFHMTGHGTWECSEAIPLTPGVETATDTVIRECPPDPKTGYAVTIWNDDHTKIIRCLSSWEELGK